MTKRSLVSWAVFIASLMLVSSSLFAEDCTLDSDSMDRGEQKAFIVCGEGIPTNYELEGLTETNITVDYQQHLEMCDIGIETPGLYLILDARDDATTASLSILDGDTGDSVCEDLTITVADRIHVEEASLTKPRHVTVPIQVLEIKGDASQDLRDACSEGLTFPEGKWPSLSLLSQDDLEDIPPLQRVLLQIHLLSAEGGVAAISAEVKASYLVDQPLICTESSIAALVKVVGEQRYPAKIVISRVGGEGGKEQKGVAYAMLPPPEWLHSMRREDEKYVNVQVNGSVIRTRYFEKGRGDALLLVHGGQAGSTGTAQSWEQNFDDLSKYFHVYALDQIAMGYTDNPKRDEDYENYHTLLVDHLYGFIQAMGIKKVHLVGHSQGGWPVTRIALDHPEMVKSLVNIDGNPAPRDPLRRATPFFMYTLFFLHPPEGPNMESLRRGSGLASYTMNNITDEKLERSLLLSGLPKIVEAAEQMVRHGMNPGHPSYQALQAEALQEIQEGKLKVPTLALWGYHDPIMPIHEVGIELFKIIVESHVPGTRLLVFDDCSHTPHVEYPDLFNRTIRSFCGAYASPPVS
jgi:pimeloyl-ACP methyl ester carboxylesterase